MTEQSPSIEALRASIDHLEARLGTSDRSSTIALMGHYWALVARFGIDLPEERDRLLGRSGALMVIQAADQGDEVADD